MSCRGRVRVSGLKINISDMVSLPRAEGFPSGKGPLAGVEPFVIWDLALGI